jgi:hypothetical protein
MIIARQSTARIVTVGPVLDADGVAKTDLAVGGLKIAKNGGAPAALNGSATLTHRNTGHYSLSLTTSDLDTVGSAEIVIDSTTNAMPVKVITVVEEAVYDDLFAASAPGYLKPTTAGRTLDVAATGEAGLDFDNIKAATGATTLTNITVPTVTTLTGHTPQTADHTAAIAAIDTDVNTVLSRIGSPTVSLAADLDDVDTAIAALNNLSAAQVNSEMDAAIETYHLDHLLAAAYDPASKPGNASGLLNVLVENDGGVPRFTANALEQGPSGGGGLTLEDIADAVWDEAIAGHLDSGSTGAALNAAGGSGDPWETSLPGAYGSGTAGFIIGTNLNATVGSRASQTSVDDVPTNAELDTAISSGLATYDGPTNAEMVAAFTEIKGATWAATDTLEAIRDRGDAAWVTATGFSTLDAAGVRAAVGLATASLDTQLADIPTVAEFNARTLAAADYFDPSADTVANVTAVGSVTGAVASVTGTVGGIAGTITTLDALDTAQDSQHGTTQALLNTAVPDSIPAVGSRPSVQQAVYMLVQILTDAAVAGTTLTVRKPDGSTALLTLTLDDPTTPTAKTRAT